MSTIGHLRLGGNAAYLRPLAMNVLIDAAIEVQRVLNDAVIDWRDVEMLAAKDDTESMAEFERLLTRVARAQS
jgi:hypothetical protein